jgi:hypothetical protein
MWKPFASIPPRIISEYVRAGRPAERQATIGNPAWAVKRDTRGGLHAWLWAPPALAPEGQNEGVGVSRAPYPDGLADPRHWMAR